MSKSKPETTEWPAIVYPVDGRWLTGVPHVPLSTDDATARRLVATGAFTLDAPLPPDPDPVTGLTTPHLVEVIPLTEDARAALAFYAPED